MILTWENRFLAIKRIIFSYCSIGVKYRLGLVTCEVCPEDAIYVLGICEKLNVGEDCDSVLLPNCDECKNYFQNKDIKNKYVLLVLKDGINREEE